MKMKRCTVVLRGCNAPSSDDPLYFRERRNIGAVPRTGKCIVGGDWELRNAWLWDITCD